VSRRRIYIDGKPAWAPNETGYVARVQGHGGTSAGFWTGTVVVPQPRVKLPRQPLSVTRPKV